MASPDPERGRALEVDVGKEIGRLLAEMGKAPSEVMQLLELATGREAALLEKLRGEHEAWTVVDKRAVRVRGGNPPRMRRDHTRSCRSRARWTRLSVSLSLCVCWARGSECVAWAAMGRSKR